MAGLEFDRVSHLSIIWGVTLTILTLFEWRSLEREPTKEQIMLPFIEREITVLAGQAGLEEGPAPELRQQVELGFNGPLFLACFFGPVLLFHAIGRWLGRR